MIQKLTHGATRHPLIWMTLGILLTLLVYTPGLSGTWLFDDFPNIVITLAYTSTTGVCRR